VRAQVLECDRCDLVKRCTSPVPFHGPTPAEVTVLGEAPGKQEDTQGKPFVGPAGQLLRRLMTEVGLDPDVLCWVNTASCYPTREDDGRGRAPLPTEVEACANNREAQLELAASRYVILTGNVPLQAYRPDLRIGKMHGRAFSKDTSGKQMWPMLYPVYHPAAVLRNPAWETDLKADLSRFVELKNMGEKWTVAGPETCVVCGLPPERETVAFHWDAQGVPYCHMHWFKYAPEAKKK
jgi:uracil-DNA glycosylase family 4